MLHHRVEVFARHGVGCGRQSAVDADHRRGIEPRKHFSGKFSLRVDPATHEAAAIAAAAHGLSLNQWATEAIRQAALAD